MMTMNTKVVASYSTEIVPSKDGLSLFCRKWDPAKDPSQPWLLFMALANIPGGSFTSGNTSPSLGFERLHLT